MKLITELENMSLNKKSPYNHRPFLPIPDSQIGNGPEISIMTYNTLAQALVRRSQFPTSGNAIRWAGRSKVLFEEIGDYRPDILCLQEVDVATWETEWKPKLRTFGYEAIFHASRQKRHGLAIAFSHSKFLFKSHMLVDYDNEIVEGMERSKITNNVGLFVYLKFSPEFLQEKHTSKNGLIVGTTHLYWHAFASFERTRQTYILLKSCKQFASNMQTLHGKDATFYTFIAGDFNSQPFDAAYTSITEKPVEFKGITKNGLGRSIVHDWHGETNDNDDNPDPEHFTFSEEISQKIKTTQDLHNSLELRALSLYSIGYGIVHPENSGIDNERNEPLFSNWTEKWKGLIDYICVICEWKNTNNRSVDNLAEFTQASNMRLLSLLKMPARDDMCSELLGLPQTDMYPSDHLCMMAKLELL